LIAQGDDLISEAIIDAPLVTHLTTFASGRHVRSTGSVTAQLACVPASPDSLDQCPRFKIRTMTYIIETTADSLLFSRFPDYRATVREPPGPSTPTGVSNHEEVLRRRVHAWMANILPEEASTPKPVDAMKDLPLEHLPFHWPQAVLCEMQVRGASNRGLPIDLSDRERSKPASCIGTSSVTR
jgi:hypothetical protein